MINLLPLSEKQILSQEKQLRGILLLGAIMIFLFFLFSLILFFIKIDLGHKLSTQKQILEIQQKEFEGSEVKELEQEIEYLNKMFSNLDSCYEDKFYFTDILDSFSKIVPDGLYLTNFSCNENQKKISVSGISRDREVLSEFKMGLEQEKNFRNIYFPPSNWIAPENINFFISFEIDN